MSGCRRRCKSPSYQHQQTWEFPWYRTNDVAATPDSYSRVVTTFVNIATSVFSQGLCMPPILCRFVTLTTPTHKISLQQSQLSGLCRPRKKLHCPKQSPTRLEDCFLSPFEQRRRQMAYLVPTKTFLQPKLDTPCCLHPSGAPTHLPLPNPFCSRTHKDIAGSDISANICQQHSKGYLNMLTMSQYVRTLSASLLNLAASLMPLISSTARPIYRKTLNKLTQSAFERL